MTNDNAALSRALQVMISASYRCISKIIDIYVLKTLTFFSASLQKYPLTSTHVSIVLCFQFQPLKGAS